MKPGSLLNLRLKSTNWLPNLIGFEHVCVYDRYVLFPNQNSSLSIGACVQYCTAYNIILPSKYSWYGSLPPTPTPTPRPPAGSHHKSSPIPSTLSITIRTRVANLVDLTLRTMNF